jgi:hypothetical protein
MELVAPVDKLYALIAIARVYDQRRRAALAESLFDEAFHSSAVLIAAKMSVRSSRGRRTMKRANWTPHLLIYDGRVEDNVLIGDRPQADVVNRAVGFVQRHCCC